MEKIRIEYRRVEELTPYKNNPRKNDKAVDAVAESIRQFGFRNPIVLHKNDEIVCGHTRLKAAVKLRLVEVPCIRADDLTEAQIKAYRLADNKTAERASWDDDLLATELSDIDLDMSVFGFDLVSKDDVHEDDFDENRLRSRSRCRATSGSLDGTGCCAATPPTPKTSSGSWMECWRIYC